MTDPVSFHDGRVLLHAGDCLAILRTLPDCSIDAVASDPPYHLVSIVRRFGAENAAPALSAAERRFAKTGGADRQPGTDQYGRLSRGFMGKTWDGGDIAFSVELWAEVFRVLKPGGHVVAFSGTRTYHRMACAIEDAGFEIRDMIGYLYGTGFPKSHNINKSAAKVVCQCGAEALRERGVRPVRNDGLSAPKRVSAEREEILFNGVQEQGSSASRRAKSPDHVRTEQSGLEGRRDISPEARELRQREVCAVPEGISGNGTEGRLRDGAPACDGSMGGPSVDEDRNGSSHRPRTVEQSAFKSGAMAGQSQPQVSGAWPICERCSKPIIPDGLGTALKPAQEPICLARKPLGEKTVAENVLAHRTGAVNIDGCRVPVGDDAYARNCSGDRGHADNRTRDMAFGMTAGSASAIGRHPANIVHDGSPEVVQAFPAEAGAQRPVTGREASAPTDEIYGERGRVAGAFHGDSGSAARFFSSFPMEEDQCLLQKSASDAPQPLSLQSEAVVSALSDAVTRSTQRLALNFQDYRAQNIPVSESELRIACEAVTEAIQCIERRFLLGLRQESITVKLGHVTCAATQSPTGTTTITISLSTSDHYADHVTFSITETSADRGAPDFAAKRFHYSAKADADDRLGSKHPTVKPVSLMRWLVRLVTPPGGTVLDPFAGTGTTGHAALLEGFNAVLIEREEEYRADIARRMGLVFAGEVERAHAIVKARGEEEGHESLPLFGGAS